MVRNGVYNALLKDNKELLVLHIKLTSDTNYGLEILSGDHVRLTKGDSENFVAPDMTDDPVEIRPKSTVKVSIGFTLNKDGESLTIHLGELDGEMKSIVIRR